MTPAPGRRRSGPARRRTARARLTVIAATLVAVLGLGQTATLTDAGWTDQAYTEGTLSTGWWARALARAQLIEVDGLGLELLDVTTTAAEYPHAPGPATSAVDVDALQSLLALELPALGLPLVGDGTNSGLLDLGPSAGAGLLNGYAAAADHSTATAAAGTVTDDGAVDLSPVADPSDTDLARLDLTALLDQLRLSGLTDAVVDDVSLGLGALASSATWEAGAAPEADYVLAGAELQLSSPLVGELVGGLHGAVSTLGDRLNGLLGPEGPLQRALDLLAVVSVDLAVVVVDLGRPELHASVGLGALVDELLATPLVDDDGLVTIDLTSGLVSVDLRRLVDGGDLNDLPPNTELLTAKNRDRIVASVTGLLESIVDRVLTAVEATLLETSLHLRLGATLTVAVPVVDLDIVADITVGDLLAGEPLDLDVHGDLLGSIPVGQLLDGLLTPVTRLVVPALTGALGTLLDTTLPRLVGELVEPVVTPVTGTLLPVLDPLLSELLRVTVNSQELTGPPGEETFTARALAVELLPLLGAASATVNLASSTVQVWQPTGERAPSTPDREGTSTPAPGLLGRTTPPHRPRRAPGPRPGGHRARLRRRSRPRAHERRRSRARV